MKIKIKTDKIDFEFEEPNLTYGDYFKNENERVMAFLIKCIEKVSEESNKIKEWH